jgi:hypothetical protein
LRWLTASTMTSCLSRKLGKEILLINKIKN